MTQTKADQLQDGHCFYCREMTNSYAGDPGLWPLQFCQRDGTGVTRFHHTRCVMDRLSLALPQPAADTEAVAWIVLSTDADQIRIWWRDKEPAVTWAARHDRPLIPLYAKPFAAADFLALAPSIEGQAGGGEVRWQCVNNDPYHPFEYAIQQGPHGDEFVKLLDGSCLRRPSVTPQDRGEPVDWHWRHSDPPHLRWSNWKRIEDSIEKFRDLWKGGMCGRSDKIAVELRPLYATPPAPDRAAVIEAAEAVVKDYPAAAGTFRGQTIGEDGYGSIRALRIALGSISGNDRAAK